MTNSNWEIVFFCKWKEAVKWFAAMLEYALISYRVHVILKHPPIISRKTLHNTHMGFPTGVENIGGLYPAVGGGGRGALQNLMSMGGFKCSQKIPVNEFI